MNPVRFRLGLLVLVSGCGLVLGVAHAQGSAAVVMAQSASQETPWPWYVVRASGLVGFLLLYISILLGLSIRTPGLRAVIKPVYSYSAHCWISLQALLLAFLHGGGLIFDKFAHFSLGNVFIPFSYQSTPAADTNLVAMGIIAFYLMILLVVTSYARAHFSPVIWRAVHSANLALYILVVVHALMLGTDLKNPTFRMGFIVANMLVIMLMLINLSVRLIEARRIRKNEATLVK